MRGCDVPLPNCRRPPAGDTDLLPQVNSHLFPFPKKWDSELNCFELYKRNNPGISHSTRNTLKRPDLPLKRHLSSARAISDTITAQARWAPGIRGTCPRGPAAFLQLALYFSTNENDIFV